MNTKQVSRILNSPNLNPLATSAAINKRVNQLNLPMNKVEAGAKIVIGDYQIEVLSPSSKQTSNDQGDRVVDAIESAGGITKSADLTSLNLARVLFDGEQIVVSDRSAVASLSSGIGLISINRATAADLDSLPGIGPVIASRIVSYRETNGPFTSISSLTEVSGIGEALMSKIKDLVTL